MTNPITITNANPRQGNPGPCGWNAILPSPPPPNVPEEGITADWLVIGGGFGGLDNDFEVNLGFYSRLREINQESSFSVSG